MFKNEKIHVFTSPQDVDGQLDFLSRNNYNIDIKLYLPDWLDAARLKDTRALGKKLAARGVAVVTHAPFLSLSLGSPDKRIRDYSLRRILRGLEHAAALNSRIFVVHTGFLPNTARRDHARWYEVFAEQFANIMTAANERGVVVAMENTWERDEKIISGIFAEFGSMGLKFCLDFGHANCFSQIPASSWMRAFHRYLVHLHIHDNFGKDDEHLPVGSGKIDWQESFSLLKKYKLDPSVTFEMAPDKLKRSLQYIKNNIAADR